MGRPQTPAHIEEGIRTDYLAGMSAPVVAERWGVKTWTVYNVLNRANIPRRTQSESHMGQPNWKKASEEVERRVCESYQRGASRKEIMAAYRLSPTGVDQILTRNKIPPKRQPGDRSAAHQNGKRVCGGCQVPKDLAEFSANTAVKDGLDSWCKACHASASRRHKLKKYGLSREEFDAMRERQGYRCAICQKEAVLVVDHCHETGRVRGLLCRTCNLGIGSLKHNSVTLRAAANYLESDTTG